MSKLAVEVLIAVVIGFVLGWVLVHPRPLFTGAEPLQRQERAYGPYGEIVRALNANDQN